MSNYDFKYEFVWIINNHKSPFQHLPFGCLQGDSFCPKSGSLDKFCLEIEFDCRDTDLHGAKWVLFLRKIWTKYEDLKVNCCLTVENADGEIWFEHASGPTDLGGENIACLMANNFRGYNKDRLGSTFSWPDHTVIMKGTLYFFADNADSELSVNQSSGNREQLQADLRKMYKNRDSCDVTFCVGEGKLRAHKNILGCRSAVFKKRFDHHGTLEGSFSDVIIQDFDIHAFDCFLLFLYTGEMEDSALDVVLSLHKLADTYQVGSLRTACWQTLGKELSIDSACSVLLFSVENNYGELKEMAKSFIRRHFNEVGRTNEWFKIVVGNPELAREVV